MPHLVLADDSATIQKVVELSFSDENIEVHSFADGASALQYLRNHPADVLLADISLPLMDGYELCREVKQNPETAHISVILLAGTFEPFSVERAEEVGYHSHLTKPFETSRLVDLVKKLLASIRRPTQAETVKHERGRQIPGLLFHIPLQEENGHDAAFSLTLFQCRPLFTPLKRHVMTAPHPKPEPAAAVADLETAKPESQLSLSAEEVDFLLRKVLDRLPDELRRMIPEIAREVLKRS